MAWGFAIGAIASTLLTDQPDTSGMNNAAQQSSQVAADTLRFNREQWNEGRGMREAMGNRAMEVSGAQLDQMRQQSAIAADYDRYNRRVFRPNEERLVAEAQNYDTPAARAAAAEQASAGVEASFGRAREGLNRDLMRREGSGPIGSGRSVAMMQDAALAGATARAGATSQAVQNVEQQGYARRMDAASLGRGLAGNQATSAQIASQAGNASNNAMQSAMNGQNAGIQMMNQGSQIGMAGYGQAGQLYGQMGNQQLQHRGQDMDMLGNAFNSYMRYGR